MATTPNYQLPAFIVEFFKRLFTKKPVFFKILQYVGIALGIITGAPLILQSWGIQLPEAFFTFTNKYAAIISAVTIIIAQLTAATETIAKPAETLPFTAKVAENKAAEQLEEKK